ncbi:MAG: TolC family protein, partial [Phycisphaerales bacterium]|nr:TolC family protein [Phycisphaerales bacterium]
AAIWQRPAKVSRAEAELQQRILTVSDAALRLVEEVRGSFADVAFAERGEALARENVTLLEQALEPLRDRFAVGEASRLDVTRAEYTLLTARTQLTDRIRARSTAQRRLLALIGRAPANVDWHCDDTAFSFDQSPPLPTEEAVIALTLAQRLDVAAARSMSSARAADLDLEDVNRLPDVSAGVGFQENFGDRQGVFPTVNVTPKLFDDNSARRARAQSLYEQARLAAEHAQETAIGEARSAWTSYVSQHSVVARYDDAILPVVLEQRDLAREAFRAGETDLTVLLDAEHAFNAARLDRLDRHHTATRLRYELERTVGGSLNFESISHDDATPLPPEVAR